MSELVRNLILSLATLILFLVGINSFVKHKIATAIEDQISNLGETGYEHLKVNIWSGNIQLNQIHFDTKLGNISSSLSDKKVEGKANKIYIDGLSWWNLWRNSTLVASEIGLEGAIIDIYDIEADTIIKISDTRDDDTFKAEIKSIIFKNGAVQLFKNKQDTISDISIRKMLLEVESFEFDSSKKGVPYTINKVRVDVEDISLMTKESLEKLQIQKIYTQQDDLLIENLSFSSEGVKEEFIQLLEWRKSWIDVRIPVVKFDAVNWQKLFEGTFSSTLAHIQQPSISAHSDQNLPKKPDDYKKLPMQVFTQTNFGISIDSIHIENAEITYELLAEQHQDVGKIFWRQVNASASNLTNDSLHILDNDQFVIEVQSRFMDATSFNLNVNFDLDHPNFAYHFQGNLGKINLTSVNRMFEYAMHIRAESGIIEQLSFNIYANNDIAKGDMIFYYRDLDMQLLDEKYRHSRKIIERVAEIFLIKKNNLANGRDKRGKVEIERDKETSIFNQLWSAVSDGMASVILP